MAKLFDGNSSNPVLTSFGEQFKLMSKTDRKMQASILKLATMFLLIVPSS